jgi:TPR repeat protein
MVLLDDLTMSIYLHIGKWTIPAIECISSYFEPTPLKVILEKSLGGESKFVDKIVTALRLACATHVAHVQHATYYYSMMLKFYQEHALVQMNPVAENMLGVINEMGFGAQKNSKEAFRLYNLSAQKGYSYAQYNLGNWILYNNNSSDLIFSEVFRLYSLSSAQGNSFGQNGLAEFLLDGVRTQKNSEEALRLFKLSAQENSDAQINLAILYFNGKIVKQDYQESLRLFEMSLQHQNCRVVQFFLGVMRLKGFCVEKNYKLAFEWFKLSADQNYSISQYQIGKMYLKKKIPVAHAPDRYLEALNWFKLSAMNGNIDAIKEIKDLSAKINVSVDVFESIIMILGEKEILMDAAKRLLDRNSARKLISEFMQAGVDHFFLLNLSTNQSTIIMEEYSKLHEIKWLLSTSHENLPSTILQLIGSYLAWFSVVTLDPYRLTQHSKILKGPRG